MGITRQVFTTDSGMHIVVDHVAAVFTAEGSGAQVGNEFYELTSGEATKLLDMVKYGSMKTVRDIHADI
jgi:hypothetical protein